MRRSWMVGAVGLAALVFATTAAAAVVGSSQRMRFETSNGATLGWVTTPNDSSTDANHRALSLVLRPNAPGMLRPESGGVLVWEGVLEGEQHQAHCWSRTR